MKMQVKELQNAQAKRKLAEILAKKGEVEVSQSTFLNPEDLIGDFAEFLKLCDERTYEDKVAKTFWLIEGLEINPRDWLNKDFERNLMVEVRDFFTVLWDDLSALCPDGFYFGSHKEDDSLIGFWRLTEN